MGNKVEIFRSALNKFENENIRLFCEDLLEQQDDINITMPSSTSYKYHNRDQCTAGGQAKHVLMVASIMNYMLDLEYIQTLIPKSTQRDCLRVAALCHDIKKTNGGKFTVHEHPLLAKDYVVNTKVDHDIDAPLRKYIGGLCASHSGQWTSNSKSSIVLPKPEDTPHFLVHLSDYLSSRADIYMKFDAEDKKAIKNEQPAPDVNTFKLPFGKHKGKTLVQIKGEDPGWIEWAKNNIEGDPVKTLLKQI